MASGDIDSGNHYKAYWCRVLQHQPNKPVVQRARQRVRAALVAVAVLAAGAGTVQVATMRTAPGSGFSTLATVGAEPTGPPGPTGGMTDGGGSQFQPPGLPPSMPDYQGGNNLPPLDQNSGISIYNSGNPQAPQQVPGQQGGQQPQQSWDQPAHGTQMPNYSTAPGYTQGPGKPNPDYQAPQQNSPQQGQQSPQQGQQQQQQQQSPQQSQEQQQNQPEQQQQQEQQDQGDQQRQQRCQAMSQQMDQFIQTAQQVADVVQQVGDAAEVVLPKGGGGSLGPDGERSPGRLPTQPLECGDCPPDRLPEGLPCEKVKAGPLRGLCNLANMIERECDPRAGDPECANQVPVCLKKDSWQAFQPEIIAERDEYIRLGKEFIQRNGGAVYKRDMTPELKDRKKRETDAARTADPVKYAGKQVGHGPDMVWGGGPGKLDARDLFPMDGPLNQSIGGQSNAFDTGYKATDFVKGVWSSAPKMKDKRCVATVPVF